MDEKASRHFIQDQVERLKEFQRELTIENIETQGFDVFITFIRQKDGERHTIRLRCDDGYPVTPPSVIFVDPQDKQDKGSNIWPSDGEQAIKKNNNPPFICIPGVREGHQHHRDWPIKQKDLQLVAIISKLVIILNK